MSGFKFRAFNLKSGCAFEDSTGIDYILDLNDNLIQIENFDRVEAARYFFVGIKNGSQYWLNEKGKLLFKKDSIIAGKKFSYSSISKDFFEIQDESKRIIGVKNRRGKTIFSGYEKVTFSSLGFFIVEKAGLKGVLGTESEILLPLNYQFIKSGNSKSDFPFLMFGDNSKKVGLFHFQKGIILEPEFSKIECGKDDLILVQKGNNYAVLKCLD